MAQLEGDVTHRVARLPKPSSLTDGMQPIFEAVSNSMHAIYDRFKAGAVKNGRIIVDFSNLKSGGEYAVTITDNGIGLDPERFKAFCTTDTPFKIQRGGKGVGRLLWLDAFKVVHVTSVYADGDKKRQRTFDFGLDGDEPIYNECDEVVDSTTELGTIVEMRGLRSNSYSVHMPSRFADIRKHFASHFLADFLLKSTPSVSVSHADSDATFPDDVNQLLLENRQPTSFDSEIFGRVNVAGYVLHREASSDLDGDHQIHLVSSGRTVQTRKIDGLLGVKRIGEDENGVFHACVSGDYLDERVNQERTQFNFNEKIAADLTKECVENIKTEILGGEVETYQNFRLERLEHFIEDNPSFGFEPAPQLLAKTPMSADSNEAFAQALIRHKVRADRDRQKMVQSVLDRLTSQDTVSHDLALEVRDAAVAATADENRQLMEYIIRRKFIIEILDALLGKVRVLSGKFDTHIEETFHQLMCPMKIVGDDPYKPTPTSHDLWLLDERLAPAVYFASDAPTGDFIEDGDTSRIDLMVWDKVHGLGLGEDDKLDRVLLVELKKPERTSYKGDYVLGRQMNRYMTKLKSGQVRSHTGDIIEISENCVFHCYIVADIEGDLKLDTQAWLSSPSGRGKFQFLQGDFRGVMEVIEWKELVRDAKVRNKNFLEAASLAFTRKGEPIFPDRTADAAE